MDWGRCGTAEDERKWWKVGGCAVVGGEWGMGEWVMVGGGAVGGVERRIN